MISYTSRRNFIFFGYFSGNVKFRLFIEVFRYIFTVFSALFDAFRQKIFDLSVHGTEVVFRPCGDRIV